MRPRVLFLTQVLPYPLDSGPKVRAYYVLRALAQRADVHLVSFVRDDDSECALDHLRGVCVGLDTFPMRRSTGADAGHLVRAMLGGKSFIVARDEVAGMHALLDRLTTEMRFDAVHADQLWMAQYAGGLVVPWKVLDQHNAVFRIFERLAANEGSPVRRWMLRRESARLARYEAWTVEAFDHVLFVSDLDLADVEEARGRCGLEPRFRSSVVPISIDLEAHRLLDASPEAHRVTVLGTMYWPPNVEGALWLAERVWPTIRSAVPGAVLTVIGKRPPREVSELAARLGAGIEVTGYVADPTPWLRETAVFAVPLHSAGGMRVKILDAWAWGLPVVSTPIGAEGLRFVDGEELLCAASPEEFAERTIRLLVDPAARTALRQAGRRAVEAHYDAKVNYRHVLEVYEPLWSGQTGGGPG